MPAPEYCDLVFISLNRKEDRNTFSEHLSVRSVIGKVLHVACTIWM